jgi:hypothetical protein
MLTINGSCCIPLPLGYKLTKQIQNILGWVVIEVNLRNLYRQVKNSR